ncbi:MAG: Co2+/Mg2+ efflux protein ApaG [Alphaproteobacteria bacterium]|nr:Co2+/Mg2+ efflux protein ApaG [Alphaproteobacteria bacterium]
MKKEKAVATLPSWSATSHDIVVTVRVQFLPDHSDGEEHHFVWAYHVIIENKRHQPIQLIKRHWQIMDALGNRERVSGLGVVGEQPVIAPQESYSYSSGCPLATTSGMMMGHYDMVIIPSNTTSNDAVADETMGQPLEVTIPPFPLEIPNNTRVIN